MKKKKKGLTIGQIVLIVLGVIVGGFIILLVALALFVPSVTDVVDDATNSVYQTNLRYLERYAQLYVDAKHPTVGSSLKLDMTELNADIRDAKDRSIVCDGYVIVTGTEENYVYTPYLKCGNNYKTKGYKE